MKKFAYFVVLLIVVMALVPWLTGIYFKQKLLDLVIALNQDSSTKINVVEYHRGWLHSHVIIHTVSMAQPNGTVNIPPVELTLDEKITHGPIIFNRSGMFAMASIESQLHISKPIETLLLGNQSSQGILQVHSIADFSGNWKNHFQIPAFNVRFSNGGNLSWDGLIGDSTMQVSNGRINSVQSQCVIGTLSANTTAPLSMQLNIQPISLLYNGTLHPIGLWIGNFSVSIPNLLMTNSTGKNIHVESLNLSTTNDVTSDNLYNGTEELSLKRLELPNSDITTVSPANIKLTINQFNAKGIVDLGNFLKQVHSTDLSNDQQRNQMLALIAKITTPNSTLNADASFNTSLGTFALTGKLFGFTNTPSASFADILKTGNLQMNMRVAVPLANKLLESYFQTLASQSNNRTSGMPISITPNIDQASVEIFNDKIAGLMKQGKLSLSTSMQIMTLRGQNLTPDQFTAGLASLNLSPETVTQITQIYNELLKSRQTVQTNEQSSSDKTKTLISQWVQNGYLLQDQSDYVASVTRDNGAIKINGKPVAN